MAPRLGYLPALDGIRALAILAVMGFHYVSSGRSLLRGGFLGVDAFFVLSGFLITALLLQERGRHGRVSLRNFYVRRALRLLPLVVVFSAAGALVWALTPNGWAQRPSLTGVLSVLTYWANWMTIIDRNALGFMGHAWSLSIEEQFYVVWPTLLVAMFVLRLRATRILVVACGLAILAATFRAVSWQQAWAWRPDGPISNLGRLVAANHKAHFWDLVYFNSFARADSLLIGCALAIVLAYWWPYAQALGSGALTVAGWVGFAGAVAIVARATIFGYFVPVWGLPVFELCVAGVVLSVVVLRAGLLARVLGLPPLEWIGRRSYGIYVIHASVIILWGHTGIGGAARLAAYVVITFGLAAVSYTYFEMPFLRLKSRFATDVT